MLKIKIGKLEIEIDDFTIWLSGMFSIMILFIIAITLIILNIPKP